MIYLYGSRLYGRCERAAGTFVATTFAHVNFVPLFPLRSQLVLSEGTGANSRVVRVPLHVKSVLLGYARVWGIPIAIGLFFSTWSHISSAITFGDALGDAVEGLFVIGAVTAAYALGGRLSRDTVAQRLVYRKHVGAPVELTILGDERATLAKKLRRRLAAHTLARSPGYRESAAKAAKKPHYGKVALDPNVVDRDYIEAAFTLARLDELDATPYQRRKRAARRAAIWARLQPLDAELLDELALFEPSGWERALRYVLVAAPITFALVFYGLALAHR